MTTEIRKVPLFRALALKLGTLDRINDSAKRFNWSADHKADILERNRAALAYLAREFLPSGSGLDVGTRIYEDSTAARIILYCEFHHMNEFGIYDGWTQHKITVRPSLEFEFELAISGRNRNDIKEYLSQLYDSALRTAVDEFAHERQAVEKLESSNA
jgi:hypothetical protein